MGKLRWWFRELETTQTAGLNNSLEEGGLLASTD
jgi:hypothetical protein